VREKAAANRLQSVSSLVRSCSATSVHGVLYILYRSSLKKVN